MPNLNPQPGQAARSANSQAIKKDIAVFLKKKGTITHLPRGASAYVEHSRKHISIAPGIRTQ